MVAAAPIPPRVYPLLVLPVKEKDGKPLAHRPLPYKTTTCVGSLSSVALFCRTAIVGYLLSFYTGCSLPV